MRVVGSRVPAGRHPRWHPVQAGPQATSSARPRGGYRPAPSPCCGPLPMRPVAAPPQGGRAECAERGQTARRRWRATATAGADQPTLCARYAPSTASNSSGTAMLLRTAGGPAGHGAAHVVRYSTVPRCRRRATPGNNGRPSAMAADRAAISTRHNRHAPSKRSHSGSPGSCGPEADCAARPAADAGPGAPTPHRLNRSGSPAVPCPTAFCRVMWWGGMSRCRYRASLLP